MKVKFYQFKRLGFTKIASLVTLEFDLVFLHIFLLIFIFFWNFETVNSNLMDLKFRFRRFSPNFKKFGRFFSRFGCPRDLVRLAPRLGPALAYLTFSPAVEADGASAHAHAKKKRLVLYSTSWVPTDVPNTVLTDWPAWCEAGSNGAYYYTYSVGHTKHSYSKLVEASSTAFSKAVAVERRHPPQLRRPSAHEPDHRHLPPPSWCYPCSARRTEAPSAAACWWRGSLVSFVTDDSAKQTSWSAAARSPRLPACLPL
jgi:hypothetical protein